MPAISSDLNRAETPPTSPWSVKMENEYLLLRPLCEDDFDELFQAAADPLIWEQHPDTNRYQLESFTRYFAGAVESSTAYVIVNKSDHAIIGSTRYYDYNSEDSQVAIGYTFIIRKYWGTDYNKSIKQMMLNHAFDFVNNVIFHVGAGNIRSQKAIRKTGALLESQNGDKMTFKLTKINWQQHNLEY